LKDVERKRLAYQCVRAHQVSQATINQH